MQLQATEPCLLSPKTGVPLESYAPNTVEVFEKNYHLKTYFLPGTHGTLRVPNSQKH